MGSCCSGGSRYGAFRHELGAPLIEEVASKYSASSSPDAKVIIVRLAALRDIRIGNSYSGLTDAYVELKILPPDLIAGNQTQVSSIRPSTLSPQWQPPERFQFVVSKVNETRVVLSM
jgi:hypothetical protein